MKNVHSSLCVPQWTVKGIKRISCMYLIASTHCYNNSVKLNTVQIDTHVSIYIKPINFLVGERTTVILWREKTKLSGALHPTRFYTFTCVPQLVYDIIYYVHVDVIATRFSHEIHNTLNTYPVHMPTICTVL